MTPDIRRKFHADKSTLLYIDDDNDDLDGDHDNDDLDTDAFRDFDNNLHDNYS